jgi:ABC-type microcin C transport system permease subunit YejE
VVLVRHALRNAPIPIVTVIGINVGILLGGSAVIEIVFVLPGVGQLVVRSLYTRDLPVIQGLILHVAQKNMRNAPWIAIFPGAAIAVSVLGLNLFGDAVRDAMDPRMRT